MLRSFYSNARKCEKSVDVRTLTVNLDNNSYITHISKGFRFDRRLLYITYENSCFHPGSGEEIMIIFLLFVESNRRKLLTLMEISITREEFQ